MAAVFLWPEISKAQEDFSYNKKLKISRVSLPSEGGVFQWELDLVDVRNERILTRFPGGGNHNGIGAIRWHPYRDVFAIESCSTKFGSSISVYRWRKNWLEEIKWPRQLKSSSGHIDYESYALVGWQGDDLLVDVHLEDWGNKIRIAKGRAILRYVDKIGEPLDVISDVEWKPFSGYK